MAPSTVFSYLRRDHRRPSSPAPSSPSTNPSASSSNLPPQLPHLDSSYSPKLADTLVESAPWFESQVKHQSKGREHVPEARKYDGRDISSSALQIPPPLPSSSASTANLDRNRPNSVGNDNSGDSLQSQPQTMLRLDQHDNGPYNSKPTSPWKLTFGKNILSDSSKGGVGGGHSPGGNTRGKLSPPEYAAAESKPESNSTSRRDATHDFHYEPAPSRPGKTRLNLLNPMALLARRRSGQTLTPRPEDIGTGRLALPALPDDYDPRIRGKLFHDFSAPRPRPNASVRQPNGQQSHIPAAEPTRYELAALNENDRPPPLPKDNAEGDNQVLQIDKKKLQEDSSTQLPSDLPPPPPPYDKPLPLRQPSTKKQPQNEPARRPSSKIRSSSTKSRASTVHDPSFQPSGLPRHLTSNASRFSFDMAGGDSSSQEKLMEEKHKQKEEARRAKAQLEGTNDSDSDDFDYDAMMDDDGLEERIPGVNADYEDGFNDDGFSGGQVPAFRPQGNLFVPVLPTVLSNPMSPLDLNSSAPRSPDNDQLTPLMITPNPVLGLPGSGLSPSSASLPSAVAQNGAAGTQLAAQPLPQPPFNPGLAQTSILEDDEDDLYFDDGLIDDILEETDDAKFDESIFDDETSHLYERKTRFNPSLPAEPENRYDLQDDDDGNIPLAAQNSLIHRNTSSKSTGLNGVNLQANASMPIRGLTQGNLEQYHSALAKAANEAALNGRFERGGSISEKSADQESVSQSADSHPGLTADDSRVSQNVDSVGFDDVLDDFDYNDDYLDDDPIIAAANAEALENDDEGFYGQEFGFYPQALTNCDSEMILGGYFGTRGVEGITRSHSGRVNFQEPSLTPITERSEWSTRNSIISLTTHGAAHPNASLTSPPFAQLADIEDEMSLSALMKLRRGAWGGSNGSLRSSAASQGHTGSSPSTHQAPSASSNLGNYASLQDMLADQSRPNSMTNSSSNNNNGNSSPLSTSMTTMESNNYNYSPNPYHHSPDTDYPPATMIPPPPPPASEKPAHIKRFSHERDRDRPAPPLSIDTSKANIVSSPLSSREDRTHSRANSAAESISYVKEVDEDGGDRWVLERRRTGESGEREVVEREVVGKGVI
ncbi:hypothetical protein FQN53_007568 [Emmonsiellopsis sp. PD_33]|nr:hypothetical protein FQN53_007568 [Emmonsiellopsis sp. PD_33]